jgi:hypothetical protein
MDLRIQTCLEIRLNHDSIDTRPVKLSFRTVIPNSA